MYKKITLLLVIFVLVFSIENITIEAATSKTVNLGATTSLKVQTNKSIKWSSSNKKIVSVDKKGKITANRVGKATIKAKVNKKIYKFYIAVVDPYADSTKLKEAKKINIKVIAHRGMSSLAPENTIEAIEMAAIYGFEMVEFDVSQTKDGKFIVMHDSSVDRTTNGKGKIKNLTFDEIKSLKIDGGNGYSKKYKNAKVPSLEEVLKICKKRNLTPLIHVKSVSDISGLLKVVKKSGFSSKAILCSSSTNTLVKIKAINKKVKLLIVVSGDGQSAVKLAKKNKLTGINISSKALDLKVLKDAKQNGMTVYVWDVYSKSSFASLIEYEIDGIVSNGVFE